MNENDPSEGTRDWIELKLASFRSEVRLLFVLSIAGNQVLAHLSLSAPVAYAGSGGVFAVAAAKVFFFR